MQTTAPSLWWLRTVTFFVAALASASAAVWLLKWTNPASSPPAIAAFSEAPAADAQAVARLLGGNATVALAAPAVDDVASHFRLTGVVAGAAQGGVALIAVDGQPTKPYRVGSQVNEELVLQSVAPRSATLAARLDGPVTLTLNLPKL